ncbi:MAG: histidine ammonia-lyase [Methanomicrobia archaeon]|nr:histidine ammonia-lyase [Methanomicrobia archaeon]
MLIDGESLTIEDVYKVACLKERVELDKTVKNKVERSRKIVEEYAKEEKVAYGITTGLGELCNVFIHKDQIDQLQKNLIRSHSTCVGNYLGEKFVRAAILLRANSLSKGYSGVRYELIERLISLLNKDITPCIPEKGSVGASGDLAPLAHIALVLMGEGDAFHNGKLMKAEDALKAAGIEKIELKAKEGLALINGTQIMTAIAALCIYDAKILFDNALKAAAMSLEALRGTDRAFLKEIQKVRPHKGQIAVAKKMMYLLKESENILSHRHCEKVQDAYTLRCIPQVLGPSLETIEYAESIVNIELNSATDNPLIFDSPLTGGNFHGQPIALAMDFLGIALSEIGSISERRINRLMNPHLSELPPFLAKNSGLNTGFMIAHYTAASLVSENKILAHPASVDSIPVSADQEDHVSMGTIAARKCYEILQNVKNIVAIEFLAASQGIDLLKYKPSYEIQKIHKKIREKIPFMEKDRPIYRDIEKMREIMENPL